jgi:signal transduction histidine kinase
MKREAAVLLAFIKDKLSLLALFAANTILITLFFTVYLESNEWLYPIIISCTIFIPYIIVQWVSYRRLMSMLDFSETAIPEEIYTNTEYLKKINLTLINIHRLYNNKLNAQMQKNIEARRFVSQLVHAMKTPVTVIELATQKYKENLENKDSEYDLSDITDDISKENQRQLEMLNNLLEYLRLEEFSKDYTPVSTDLYSELTQIINNKKRSFIYGNVRPNISINSSLSDKNVMENSSSEKKAASKAEIITDIKWNRIMLDQIISNAIKYSAAAEKMKTVDFSILQMEDKTILTVSDKGIGIPPQDIPKVMDAFFTGDNGRKMKNATGIGMYIVKLISENLGHEIHIESQVGVGTRIEIIYHKIQNNRLI